MKTLNKYLIEALISRNTEIQTYNFHPTSFDELRSLIEQLLEERGEDANLNDIDVSQVNRFDKGIELGLFEDLDPHNIDISEWNVSKVRNMYNMFYNCKNFTGQGLEKWNVSNVENMGYMFCDCKNFNCNLSKWNVSKVVNMYCMFRKCTNFTGHGLENWKPIKCKDMRFMFKDCTKFNCNLSKWNVSNIDKGRMKDMFKGCTSLKNNPSWYKK